MQKTLTSVSLTKETKWDASLRWHDSLVDFCRINFWWFLLNKAAKNTVMPAKAGIPFSFLCAKGGV